MAEDPGGANESSSTMVAGAVRQFQKRCWSNKMFWVWGWNVLPRRFGFLFGFVQLGYIRFPPDDFIGLYLLPKGQVHWALTDFMKLIFRSQHKHKLRLHAREFGHYITMFLLMSVQCLMGVDFVYLLVSSFGVICIFKLKPVCRRYNYSRDC